MRKFVKYVKKVLKLHRKRLGNQRNVHTILTVRPSYVQNARKWLNSHKIAPRKRQDNPENARIHGNYTIKAILSGKMGNPSQLSLNVSMLEAENW